MTETTSAEYMRLSFKVGVFAGDADHHLGRPHFAALCRASAWDLTPEKLDVWRAEARMMGVPDVETSRGEIAND